VTNVNPAGPRSGPVSENKSWLLPVIVILMSTGLTVLAADLALRFLGRDLFYYRPNEMFIQRWPKLPLVSRYKAHVRYEGRTYGDLAAMLGGTRFRQTRRVIFETDDFGFPNGPDVQNQTPHDVVILGDSCGVGLGTTQERTWPALLRERHGLRVYNLSIPGGSPWQGYIHLASEAGRLRFHPGSVVLVTVFSGNDLDDYYPDKEVALADLPWNNAWASLGVRAGTMIKRSPLFLLATRLRHGTRSETKVLVRALPEGRPILFYAPYAANRGRPAEMVRRQDNYPRLVRTLENIMQTAAENGLTMAVALFPSKEEVYGWVIDGARCGEGNSGPTGLGVALATSCREKGINFFDLTPMIIAAADKAWEESGDLVYWIDDTHWNEAGHGLVADLLRPFLENCMGLFPKPS